MNPKLITMFKNLKLWFPKRTHTYWIKAYMNFENLNSAERGYLLSLIQRGNNEKTYFKKEVK